MNSDSLYAIDCTIATGSAAHSATASTPARRPYRRSATAKIPQAAASPATAETTRPADPWPSPVTAETKRSSQGSSGKKARLEWTSPLGRTTSYPYPSAAMRAYQSESQRAESSVWGLLPAAAPHTASTASPNRRTAAKTARAGAARRNPRSFTGMIIGGGADAAPRPRGHAARSEESRRSRHGGVGAKRVAHTTPRPAVR